MKPGIKYLLKEYVPYMFLGMGIAAAGFPLFDNEGFHGWNLIIFSAIVIPITFAREVYNKIKNYYNQNHIEAESLFELDEKQTE